MNKLNSFQKGKGFEIVIRDRKFTESTENGNNLRKERKSNVLPDFSSNRLIRS